MKYANEIEDNRDWEENDERKCRGREGETVNFKLLMPIH